MNQLFIRLQNKQVSVIKNLHAFDKLSVSDNNVVDNKQNFGTIDQLDKTTMIEDRSKHSVLPSLHIKIP